MRRAKRGVVTRARTRARARALFALFALFALPRRAVVPPADLAWVTAGYPRHAQWAGELMHASAVEATAMVVIRAAYVPQVIMCIALLVYTVERSLFVFAGRRVASSGAAWRRWRMRQSRKLTAPLLRWLKIDATAASVRIPVVLTAAVLASLLVNVAILIVTSIKLVPMVLSEAKRRQPELERELARARSTNDLSTNVASLQYCSSLQGRVGVVGEDSLSGTHSLVDAVAVGVVHERLVDALSFLVAHAQPFSDWLAVAMGFGALLALYLSIAGCLHTWETYALMYDVVWHHGPAVLRFPVRRANSPRFFSTFVAFQLGGALLTICACVVGAGIGYLLYAQWEGSRWLRAFVLSSWSVTLIEMLIVRTILTPIVQRLSFGPASFMLELWCALGMPCTRARQNCARAVACHRLREPL